MRNSDRGHISLSAFLYLAMVCFVSPKEPSEGIQQQSPPQQQGLISAAGGDRRLFVRGRGDAAAAAASAGFGGSAVDGGNHDDLDCAATDGYGSSIDVFSPRSTPTPGGRGSLFGDGLVAADAGEGHITIPASVSCAFFSQRLTFYGVYKPAV